MIDRRGFVATLVGGVFARPLVTEAQRLGFREVGFLCSPSSAPYAPFVAAFRHGLNEGGYIEGKNITIEFRWADGHYDRLSNLAPDLVRRQVAVLVAVRGNGPVLAAKAATATIPIVFASGGDPVRAGIVASRNRPGANVTGVNQIFAALVPKQLELLLQLVPKAGRLSALVNPNYPDVELQRLELKEASTVIKRPIHIVNAGSQRAIDAAFLTFVQPKTDALLVANDPFFHARRDQIVALAARSAIPAMYFEDEFAVAGGLISYGASLKDTFHEVGIYTGRILKRAKPADLPIEQPTKFELVVNLKAAKAPGPDHPPVAPAAGGSGDRVVNRRAFIGTLGLGLLAAPLAAGAQPAGKIFRIGILGLGSSELLRQTLREVGYVEGLNLALEWRDPEGKTERFGDLAADLVRLKVDVIVAINPAATFAAKRSTASIPIVMVNTPDPVQLGLVVSLGRPGGNITGTTTLSADVSIKQLELLKAAVPRAVRIAVLWNPTNPWHPLALKGAEAAARSLALQLHTMAVRGPEELDAAFAAMARERAGAVLVLADPMTFYHRARLADLAAKRRLPTMYGGSRGYVEDGGLMHYWADQADLYRRVGSYVDRILKGAKPGDLPIEQPTKFELVINLKTAKTLGLTIPPSLLQRADQVIE